MVDKARGVLLSEPTVAPSVYKTKRGEVLRVLLHFAIHILFWILFSTILVLNGFFRIFFTSVQWGIRRRVVFLLFWWVPVAGLVLLVGTCRLVRQEYEVETEKQKLNALRGRKKPAGPIILWSWCTGSFSATGSISIIGGAFPGN